MHLFSYTVTVHPAAGVMPGRPGPLSSFSTAVPTCKHYHHSFSYFTDRFAVRLVNYTCRLVAVSLWHATGNLGQKLASPTPGQQLQRVPINQTALDSSFFHQNKNTTKLCKLDCLYGWLKSLMLFVYNNGSVKNVMAQGSMQWLSAVCNGLVRCIMVQCSM